VTQISTQVFAINQWQINLPILGLGLANKWASAANASAQHAAY